MKLDNGKLLFYHLVFAPGKAIEYLLKDKEDKHIGIALLIMGAGVIFNLLSQAIVSLNRGMVTMYVGLGGLIAILNFTGNLILFSAVIFFIRSFALGEKEIKQYNNKNYALVFFKLICFSFFPLLFTPVLSLFALFFNSHTIFKILVYIWIIYLQILIIKKIFSLKTLTSIALYVLPLVGLFAFLFVKIINQALSFLSTLL